MIHYQISIKLVARHSYTPGILYPDGKNCAVPVSYRDFFVAKDEAQWPVLRQVTPTNFIAGPLGVITMKQNRNMVVLLPACPAQLAAYKHFFSNLIF